MNILLKVTGGPHKGREYLFHEHDTFVVGRGSAAHFRLPAKDPYFSRVHFMIELNPPGCRLVDLRSRNGTFVNGRRVEQADLRAGDKIHGGDTTISVIIRTEADAAATLPPGAVSAMVRRTHIERKHGKRKQRPGRVKAGQRRYAAVSTCVVCGKAVNRQKPHVSAAQPDADAVLALLCRRCSELARQHRQPIPDYRIVRELGKGGMGIVYLAVDEELGECVALKVIQPANADSKNDIDRFLREADILRDLEHPCIVKFIDSGESEGQLYFAMEYVSGVDASRLVKNRDGLLPVGRAVGIACRLLEALAHAHERGFVHRDIKPQNVMLTNVGGRQVVKLTDFGLARAYQASRLSGLTLTDSIGGTPAFMAPDQVTNFREAKPACDQYSAGATLYYLLTAQYIHDFPRDICGQILFILQEPATPIRTHRDDIPTELADVIHRSLEKNAEKRYPDVESMRQALLPFVRDEEE